MKKNPLLFWGLLCVLVALIASPFFIRPNAPAPALHQLVLRSPDGTVVPLEVEWATTDPERELGLMNRTHVDHGMLFFFDTEQPLNFWMKNTLIPLDIVFFDANGRMVSATTMQPCTADPCATYPSGAPAKYALEMPEGFLATEKIQKDWTIVQ